MNRYLNRIENNTQTKIIWLSRPRKWRKESELARAKKLAQNRNEWAKFKSTSNQ